MNFRSFYILISIIGLINIAIKSAFASPPVQSVPCDNLPENQYIYGAYDINSGEVGFGVAKNEKFRNGGHYIVADRLVGGLGRPGPGEGHVVGFGVVRQGNSLFVGPMALKAAGSTADPSDFTISRNTINPQLPMTNPTWSAIMPMEYASQVFDAVIKKTGMLIKYDGPPLESVRFPFNHKKHHKLSAYHAEDATWWLQDELIDANSKHSDQYRLAAGMYTPELLPLDDSTIVFDEPWTDRAGRNMADGMKQAWDKMGALKPCAQMGVRMGTGALLPGEWGDLADEFFENRQAIGAAASYYGARAASAAGRMGPFALPLLVGAAQSYFEPQLNEVRDAVQGTWDRDSSGRPISPVYIADPYHLTPVWAPY